MMRGTPRVAVVVLVVCVALAAGGVACGGSSAPRSLVQVGDSLAIGTQSYLPDLLPGWELSSAAAVGRRSDEGLPILQNLGPSLPRVVVVSLGTNDDPTASQAFATTVRAVISLAGPDRCVVWATIARPAVGGVSYGAFNRILRAEAARSRSFKLVDWAAMVARNPSFLRSDRVHAVAAGYRVRAQETARVAKRC
jgi:lysophospholipase L1-like esterase